MKGERVRRPFCGHARSSASHSVNQFEFTRKWRSSAQLLPSKRASKSWTLDDVTGGPIDVRVVHAFTKLLVCVASVVPLQSPTTAPLPSSPLPSFPHRNQHNRSFCASSRLRIRNGNLGFGAYVTFGTIRDAQHRDTLPRHAHEWYEREGQ